MFPWIGSSEYRDRKPCFSSANLDSPCTSCKCCLQKNNPRNHQSNYYYPLLSHFTNAINPETIYIYIRLYHNYQTISFHIIYIYIYTYIFLYMPNVSIFRTSQYNFPFLITNPLGPRVHKADKGRQVNVSIQPTWWVHGESPVDSYVIFHLFLPIIYRK